MEPYTIERQPIPFSNQSLINNKYNAKTYHSKPSTSLKPPTQYTKSGEINIAYQVFGEGNIDLVYIPGWVSNIDWMWSCPELVDFLQELGKIARIILFDKRGTGLSDRAVEFSTLEERMEDIQSVMNACGSEKAVLFGHSEGGSVSSLFAATYPNRVLSLITFGVFAKRRYSTDYPWAPTDEERQQVYDMIEERWGCEKMGLETLSPSKANDPVFMDWLASYCRFGASPSAAMSLTKMNTEVNIIDILGTINVPTLILQRKNDIDVKIEEGRFMSQKIKGSKFVEFEGEDHLFWVGNTIEVLDEMKAFILDTRPSDNPKPELMTVLSTKVMSTYNGSSLYELICPAVTQNRGKITQYGKQGFSIVFKGPGKAIHCSLALMEILKSLNIKASSGIYMKEGYSKDFETLPDEGDKVAKKLLSSASPGQILITQTIKHLLSGLSLNLIKHDTVFDPLSTKSCAIYQLIGDQNQSYSKTEEHESANSVTFLESVIKTIEKHLNNEVFGVDILSRETCVSERQLQRKIKEMTNKSPNQLINSIRLNKAKELLLVQKYTVAEIAFSTGFSSPSYFSKCFKKEFGISPTSLF